MSEKRLRISIIGLLAAVAIASFGCGGGSRANPAAGGDFITAVMPDIDSTTKHESGNAILGDPPSNGDGENGSGGTIVSTPGDGGNDPGDSNQNPQTAQQSVDDGNQEEGGGNDPDSSTQNTETEQQVVDNGNQEEDFPLPPVHVHGLGAGQITVEPGNSEEHGNIVITCPAGDATCVVNVGADGAATYIGDGGIPGFTLIPPEEYPDIPLPRPNEAAQAPVLDFGDVLHVGADVAPRADELTTGVDRNGVRVSYGEVQDGIGAERVLEFTKQHAGRLGNPDWNGPIGLATFPEPPTIRLAEGTSDSYARYTSRAVQLINSALPYEKRITISPQRLPTPEDDDPVVPDGEILVEFVSKLDGKFGITSLKEKIEFNANTDRNEVEGAEKAGIKINEGKMRQVLYAPSPNDEEWDILLPDTRVKDSDTHIKIYSDDIFFAVLVHELMHGLGFYHIDVSRFAESIMNPEITDPDRNEEAYSSNLTWPTYLISVVTFTSSEPEVESKTESDFDRPVQRGGFLARAMPRVPGHILLPIDREALLAAYGRLEPGAQPDELTAENLGAWTDTSFHLRGDMDFPAGVASFGVASRNGFAQPWAMGSTPWTNLADNPALSGSATWSGALLGVGSSSETVAGDASLSVNLTNLTGRIDFTGMEKWGVNEAPGAVGSATTWVDGDLGYTIQVRGNTFIQTGGDQGQVTGAFFGAAHEAMGGVLERADLAAGFGGKR